MKETSPTPITKKAILIGVLLLIANSYWLAYIEMIWHTAHLTTVALSVNILFAILTITWLNMGVRAIAPRAALSQRDLLLIYSMLAVGSAFSGHDSMPRLMGVMSYAYRFATPENDWEALLFRHLPPWLVITDAGLVKDFYEGEAGFFTGGYWRYWAVPILLWSVVVLLLIAMFFCLTVMIRKQWVENEKLAYPIIRIPLEVSTRSGAIFSNRLLWIGFGIAAGINVLNGLEYFFPSLPSIPVKKYDLNVHFTQKPWNAMGSMPLRFHPYLIGLAFILPLDLSFSCVFFYFVAKAQMLVGSMVGVATLPGYPFLGEQGAGALVALLTVACWTGRKHLLKVASNIVHSNREDNSNEPISYRTAVVTFGVCIALLMIICVKGGMSIWGYALFIGIYLLIVVGVTRMRAELGPPIHAIGYTTPQYLMIAMIGTQRLRPGNLTMLSLMNWLSGASYASFRTHPMPDQLEAFKLAELTGIRNRGMFVALVIASIVGVVSTLILFPYAVYDEGIISGSEQIHSGGTEAYNLLSAWLVNPKSTDWFAMSILGLAFIFNLGVMFLRARFVWCPLHPAGYVIGVAPGTLIINVLWLPLVIAMTAKWVILRHGGVKAYRRAIPFFVGLVLGEALLGCFWPIVSLILRSSVYSFY